MFLASQLGVLPSCANSIVSKLIISLKLHFISQAISFLWALSFFIVILIHFCFLIISLPKLLLLNNIPTILDSVVGAAYPDLTLISETSLETKCENTSVEVQKMY